MTAEYDALAEVYDWLVPENLLEPEGAATAFEQVLVGVPPGGRVLDCAAGSGQLAVGLALRGYDVVATDVSPRMVQRTQALARELEVEVHVAISAWDDLGSLGLQPFDAILCVGNSLTHAAGVVGRRSALASMRAQLQTGGVLAVTSRNWERVRAAGSGLRLPHELVVRHGVPALVVHSWIVPDEWDHPHGLEVGVAVLDGDAVRPHVGRLTFWPFTHDGLRDDLRACGLTPRGSTYAPTAERYLVTATAT